MTCGMLFPYSGERLGTKLSPVELFESSPLDAFEKIKASGKILDYFKAFTEVKILGSISYQNELDLEEIRFNIMVCSKVKRLFFNIYQVKKLVIDYVETTLSEAKKIAQHDGLTYTLLDYYSQPDVKELVNKKLNIDPESDKGFSKFLIEVKKKTENFSALSANEIEALARKEFISLL